MKPIQCKPTVMGVIETKEATNFGYFSMEEDIAKTEFILEEVRENLESEGISTDISFCKFFKHDGIIMLL